MQKTKLVLTIEIEETFEDTNKLFELIRANSGVLKVKDVFNSESEIIVESITGINSVIIYHPFDINEQPKDTAAKCIMHKR